MPPRKSKCQIKKLVVPKKKSSTIESHRSRVVISDNDESNDESESETSQNANKTCHDEEESENEFRRTDTNVLVNSMFEHSAEEGSESSHDSNSACEGELDVAEMGLMRKNNQQWLEQTQQQHITSDDDDDNDDNDDDTMGLLPPALFPVECASQLSSLTDIKLESSEESTLADNSKSCSSNTTARSLEKKRKQHEDTQTTPKRQEVWESIRDSLSTIESSTSYSSSTNKSKLILLDLEINNTIIGMILVRTTIIGDWMVSDALEVNIPWYSTESMITLLNKEFGVKAKAHEFIRIITNHGKQFGFKSFSMILKFSPRINGELFDRTRDRILKYVGSGPADEKNPSKTVELDHHVEQINAEQLEVLKCLLRVFDVCLK